MEALVILLIPLVGFIFWAVHRAQTNALDPAVRRLQRQEHVALLEERLARGRRDNWDEQMLGNLAEQLEEARRAADSHS
jgi:hypothetical protein